MHPTIVYSGKKFQVAHFTVTDQEGVASERDVILHPGAVAILPFIDDAHIVLIRNHRVTIGQTLLEIPAGTLEPPEPPEVCARRELREETGYAAQDWQKLVEFYPSPGVMNECMYLFSARNLTAGTMELQPDETIQPEIVPLTVAFDRVRDGTIRDAKTMIALLWWQAFAHRRA